MATHHNILYFSGEIPQGDQVLYRKLHLLSKERDHAILASFLESVTSTVKDEFARLTRAERDLVPAFESVLDLNDHVVELRKSSLGGALERVLVLVTQLGSFIGYHEVNPQKYNFLASNTSLIGRGPGLLSAAAIGLAPSLSMIPRIINPIVRVAFRFGLIVDQVCRSLEVSLDEINAEGAWIYCAHNVDPELAREAVARFNSEKGFPTTIGATIFNVDGRSVSVGGPPSTLTALFSECEFFKQARKVPMKKVQGFWHTTNVYGEEHVRQIMPEIESSDRMHLPLHSPVTGVPYELTTIDHLLENIMEDTLTKPIDWEMTMEHVTAQLKVQVLSNVNIIEIQPSHYIENSVNLWKHELPSAIFSSLDMMYAINDLPLGSSPPKDTRSAKIAVVGMSCRFPGGADDPEKFWEFLMEGKDAHTRVPSGRFNVETHVDPAGKIPNTSATPFGCFVENPGLFDAMFFGMSPREAAQTDPMHRLALVTAYEALERAGYVHGRGIHARRVGTFYGQASDDYREVNSGQDIDTYFIPGGCRAFAPGRINYFFKFWGPSFSVDTACSSSLAAIQAACTSLWSGDIDMAIAGGLNILTNSDVYAGLSNGHFLSPTGNCKTWDEGADGYCRADGVGSIVLKRLEDAEADNDNILAVVLSAATDHSAEAVSITHPHNVAQAHLYTQVVRRAGVDPLTVGYVEMHGTGTQAGDKAEMTSVTNVFAPENGRDRTKDASLHIGTVKANMGHGEAAAGIMAFIKTLLVFQHGVIPPHVGIKTRLNPALPDLSKRNVTISGTATPWLGNLHKRIAMVNNFGAAGGNTSIILEEAKPAMKTSKDIRRSHVITISAKTAVSLRDNIQRIVTYTERNQALEIADLSYTLSARRSHYSYRISVVAESPAEAIALLQPQIDIPVSPIAQFGKQPPVVFTFTGQGTFYIGIGKELYHHSPLFKKHIDQLDALTRRQGFDSFLPSITATCETEDVSLIMMSLSIVCVEIALARLWISLGVKPIAVVGHSLGEYAALVVAGVLSDSAAIFLVSTRAHLLQSMCTTNTHSMLSVRTSVDEVRKSAGDMHIEIACINGPTDVVIGGSNEDLDVLAKRITAAGHRTIKLPVSHAYHTRQMDAILGPFIEQTRGVTFKKPKIPVISPLQTGVINIDDNFEPSYLAAATRGTVDFAGALRAAWDDGIVSEATVWLEIGHHPTLTGFVTRSLPVTRLACSSIHRDQDNWTTLAKTSSLLYNIGTDMDWGTYHRPFENSLTLIDAPTYAWDNKNHWIQYRGDWNLTKGRDAVATPCAPAVINDFSTSSIHYLLSEGYQESSAVLKAETDIAAARLQGAVDGHAMNGYGVASSFLHAEMAFTLAKRIRDKALPTSSSISMNIRKFEYHEPVVKRKGNGEKQIVQISAGADLDEMVVRIKWHNPANDAWYCHAEVTYEDPSIWLSDWSRSANLVTSRIDALYEMANSGKADRITSDLAYSLFGKLVDYSDMYRTMQSVILNGDEAVAEVLFPEDPQGDWTVPPHFIDGCISLSGFILNGGTHFDNTRNFFITPSWQSMRFAKPLTPGQRYLAYVRMIPAGKNQFTGDVYVIQDSVVVGVVEAIVFGQWPRVMLNRFFSPPQALASSTEVAKPSIKATTTNSKASTREYREVQVVPVPELESNSSDTSSITSSPPSNLTPQLVNKAAAVPNDDKTDRALEIIAEELAVDIGLLTDEVGISDLGLDSLMSLVLAQKLREDLAIEMRDAFFLEVDTIGQLKRLLH